jgi:hypothetical protein
VSAPASQCIRVCPPSVIPGLKPWARHTRMLRIRSCCSLFAQDKSRGSRHEARSGLIPSIPSAPLPPQPLFTLCIPFHRNATKPTCSPLNLVRERAYRHTHSVRHLALPGLTARLVATISNATAPVPSAPLHLLHPRPLFLLCPDY